MGNTRFDTSGSNRTTTRYREHILYRHQERFVLVAYRLFDPVVDSIHKFINGSNPLCFAVKGAKCGTFDDRSVVSVVFVKAEQVAYFHLYEFEKFGVVNQVHFIKEYNHAGNAYLTAEQDMLAGLGHRSVRCSYNEYGTVHLGSTRYHVLHIVGVSRAVNVSIVTLGSLILYVCSVDSYTTLFLFRCGVDRREVLNLGKSLIRKNLGYCGRKSCFTVVNVSDSTDIQMRLVTFESFFCHFLKKLFICFSTLVNVFFAFSLF